MNNDKLIISVGRQLGSGGRTIAKMLADEFGCKFYDREVLSLAARESGFSPEFFEKNDERKGFLDQIFHMHVPFISDSSFYDNGLSQENLFRIQSDAIRKAADESSCVFVGRCADYALAGRPGLLRIFCRADLTQRIKRIQQRHNLSLEKAALLVAKTDRHRRVYYHHHTGKFWGHSSCYDLTVNTSVLGVEKTAEALEAYIRAFQEQD